MRMYRRFLILSGILMFPLIVWLSISDSNDPISLVPEAYSSEGTEDHSEGEKDEHKVAATDDHQGPDAEAQAHAGPVLLPQKRTTLLSRAQLRGYTPYQFYCAACHGKRGNGDGSNAKNLNIPPRRHNDASYMANLSDAYLSRIIKEGGALQGLSPLMPPWGGVLSEDEISNLIAFLRILPEDQMVASAEEHQKSAGMGGHHQGGAMAEDHHGAEADKHDATGTDDHHAGETDKHEAAGTDDHHAGESDKHKEAVTDDHHAEESDKHKEAVSDDHHAGESDKHKEAVTDDHHAEESDKHKEAVSDDHHAEESDKHKEAGTDDH
jgi:cytochrome c oxidase cbb3-type subunit 3